MAYKDAEFCIPLPLFPLGVSLEDGPVLCLLQVMGGPPVLFALIY